MKNNKKEPGKKAGKNHKKIQVFLVMGLVIILALLMLALLFYYEGGIFSNEKNLKKESFDLKKEGIGELETSTPGGETNLQAEKQEGTAPQEEFVEGGTGSKTTSSQNSAVSANGKLTIVNSVDGIGSTDFVLAHFDGPMEELEVNDFLFYAMYCPDCTKLTKIISKIGSDELEADARPADSTSTVYLELSLVSSSGNDISVDDSTNQLVLAMPLEGYDFGEKTLTIQQYDPNNPSAQYAAYNVKDVISNNNGIIQLENLDGSYGSGEPYAYFKIMFS
jgi:hypothetical protein